MKRMALVCGLILALASIGVVSCTRAKPEAVTPTVPAAVTTPLPTLPRSTATVVITVQPPPTSVTLVVGPTTISVAGVTPTLAQGATPILINPTAAPGTTPTPVPATGSFEHTVQWGDTVFSLALRYNTTVQALAALNGLQNPSSIRVGQVLKISGTAGPAPGPSAQHTVQAGDTLYSIALRYGTTVEAIRHANGIVSDWYIRVGQSLVIPSGGSTAPSGGNTYVVQAGDTLYGIAARLGKNAWDLIVANNLSDPYWIWVGQVLVIP